MAVVIDCGEVQLHDNSMWSELSKIIKIIATNGSSVTLTLVVLKGKVGNNFFISPSLTLFTKPFHCVLGPSIVHLKTSGITKHWLTSRSLFAGLELSRKKILPILK